MGCLGLSLGRIPVSFILFSFVSHTSCLPKWSWDSVQTFMHFANQSGTFGEKSLDAFKRQAFVVIEKDQGRWPQSPQPDGYPMEDQIDAETKISLACDQVKLASPTTDCYMYTESDWARTQYNLGHDLDTLESSGEMTNGNELSCDNRLVTKTDETICFGCRNREAFESQYHVYDFRNETTRDMWVDRVVENMGDGKSIDGAFVDGNRNTWGSSVLASCEGNTAVAWGQGLNASMWLLRKRCDLAATNSDHGCTIISNYPTEEAMQMSDGGMFEKFGCSNKYIDQLSELAKAGKMTQVHAQYASSEPWFGWALACFLVGANERSYFGAGMGWDGYDENPVMMTWIKDWPEYSKPLGEPDGDALVEVSGPNNETTTYFRSFATGTTVFVNLTMKKDGQDTTTCIRWSDGSVTGNGCNDSAFEEDHLTQHITSSKKHDKISDSLVMSDLPFPVLIDMLFP